MLVYWFLPMILFLGIVTSYEDIKYGKIRNKWIVLAVAYGIIANLLLFLSGYNNLDSLIKFSINSVISLIIGFIMWHVNLWTAGDAKLLFSYSMIIPLDIYKVSESLFPSISILLYAFVPFAVFLTLAIAIEAITKNKFDYIKKIFKIKEIFQSIMFVFAFMWIIELLLAFLNIQSSIAITLLLLILISQILKLANLNMLFISVPVSLLRLAIDESVYSIPFLYRFLVIILIFAVIRHVIINLGHFYLTKKVKISSLEEGMMPAEKMPKFGKQLENLGISKSLFRQHYASLLFKGKANSLSGETIAALKKMARNSDTKYLRVYQTVSFSPFMFVSALMIIFSGLYL